MENRKSPTRRQRRPLASPRLMAHRRIYRLSGIQGNLASLLWELRQDDISSQLLLSLLDQTHALIEHLTNEKEHLHG